MPDTVISADARHRERMTRKREILPGAKRDAARRCMRGSERNALMDMTCGNMANAAMTATAAARSPRRPASRCAGGGPIMPHRNPS